MKLGLAVVSKRFTITEKNNVCKLFTYTCKIPHTLVKYTHGSFAAIGKSN